MPKQKRPGAIISERLRREENRESAQIIMVTADPNGSISAAEMTFAWDTANNDLYVNNNGATGWTLIGP